MMKSVSRIGSFFGTASFMMGLLMGKKAGRESGEIN